MAAAVVGGAFLSAALQVLFDRLASREVVNLFRGRKSGIAGLLKELKRKLLLLSAVLDDAEDKQFTNKAVKEWLDELKVAIFEADDLLGEISYEALRRKVEGENNLNSASSFDSHIEPDLKEIIAKLDAFVQEKDVFSLKGDVRQNLSPRSPPSTSLVVESDVYGRDSDKEEIVKLLISSDDGNGNSSNEIGVIPIVGMGGGGKTTIAQLVYNDVRVNQHFEISSWVCVSDEFDVLRVSKLILEAVTRNTCVATDLNQVQVSLKEKLMGKKFLLVLDGVWNENYEQWDLLKTPFKGGASGSRIIVTTRSHKVASIMKTVPVLELQHLSDEDCWLLFSKIAFVQGGSSSGHPLLEEIGRNIVKRCKGLPLAAKALAGLLRSKLDPEEWDNILRSELWDLPEDNNIIPALRLSYYYLPSCLKLCFAYCSIYPKDYEFTKEEVVLLWIAQKFVQRGRSTKPLEKIGDEYFYELVSRSFFQQSIGDKCTFSMHDLVHDLAQVVSDQFCFRLDDEKPSAIPLEARHFSYVVGDKKDDFEKLKAIKDVKGLRTFLPLNPRFNFPLLTSGAINDILHKQRSLRVLSLKPYKIRELPVSVSKLIHLSYLDLSYTRIVKLPDSVCTLYNLQTLLLVNCEYLTSLPEEIGKLGCLCRLDVSGTSLRKMPEQMAQLRSLEKLSSFVVGKGSGLGINGLKEFPRLRGTLCISGLQNVEHVNNALETKLNEKEHLEELSLEWDGIMGDSQKEREVLSSLQPHINLKYISVKNYGGTRFPNWLGDHSFYNIVSLRLEGCKFCFFLPLLGQLPSLKSLTVRKMNGVTMVGEEFYGDGPLSKPFPSLETLQFADMFEWLQWDFPGIGEFKMLQELSVINCPKLVGGLPENIPCWVRVEIRECPELSASVPKSSAVTANELVINGCKRLDLVWQGVPNIVKLELSNVPTLEELSPELCSLTKMKELWIERCPMLRTLSSTGLPPMVTSLSVRNCESLYSVIGGEICHDTCRLQELTLLNCPSLMSFAANGFPSSLRYIDIQKCQKLAFTVSQEMESFYTSLRGLHLAQCELPKDLPLRCFPELLSLRIASGKSFEILSESNGVGRSQNMMALVNLSISECNNFSSFPEEGLAAPNLIELNMSDCKQIKSLPHRMCFLCPSLRSLYLDNCPEIESFPEGGLPSSLCELQIRNCKKLVAHRRDWGLKELPSLSEFTLIGVDEEEDDFLECFPDEGLLPTTITTIWIQHLPNLKLLSKKGFQNLPLLEKLHIWNCPLLQLIPEEGLPSSLSHLQIRDCPLLTPRCRRETGDYWHKIAHIPTIEVDWQVFFD